MILNKSKSLLKYLPHLLIVIVGYIIYKRFINPFNIADSKNEKIAAENSTDTATTQGKILNSKKETLKAAGFVVNASHQSTANELHQLIDSMSVDEEKIIKIINSSKSSETFQLINIAYGQRRLPTWLLFRPLNSDFWKGLFTWDDKSELYGDLKSHLLIVLSESEQKQIKNKLSLI